MNLRMNMKKLWVTGIISVAIVGVLLSAILTQNASAALTSNQQTVSQISSSQSCMMNRYRYRDILRQGLYINISTPPVDRPLNLRLRECIGNASITVEEATITGKFTDAELGIIVLSVDGSSIVVRMPSRWIINGEVKTFIHLFVDDILVKGRMIRIDALKITATLKDGTTFTYCVAKTIIDLESGASAEAVMPATLKQNTQYSFQGQAA